MKILTVTLTKRTLRTSISMLNKKMTKMLIIIVIVATARRTAMIKTRTRTRSKLIRPKILTIFPSLMMTMLKKEI